MAADFAAVYRLTLPRDLKTISWTHFLDLLGGLPPDSRFMTAYRHSRGGSARRLRYGTQAELDAAMDSAYG